MSSTLSSTGISQTTAQRGGIVLFTLGMMIPAVLGVYWPLYYKKPVIMAAVLRPAMLALAILMAMMCGRNRVSKAEARLAGFLSLLCILWLATSLGSVDVERALADWVKLFAICLFCLLLCRTLRNPSLSKAFGYSLFGCSILISVFIVYAYFRFFGLQIPTYESTRVFKGVAERVGIPLNTIPFASVFAYMVGMCIVRSSKLLWALGSFLFIVSSIFTGSRAPLAVLGLSGFALLLVNGIRSRGMLVRWIAWVTLVITVTGGVAVVSSLSFKTLSDASEGRWDFWYVAVQKFCERPLIGYGYESFQDDLVSRVPGFYRWRGFQTHPGGYHNEYLTALAEQGLIGFLALAAVFGFLFQCCWQLAFNKWCSWHNKQWALFCVIFLVIRAGVENGGLFGYNREPADFLGFVFLALVVSRFSVEEDCARELVRSASFVSAPKRGELLAV